MCIELSFLFVKIAVPWEVISMCIEMTQNLLFLHLRKHNLDMSGSPLSGSHSLWECWSEDERMHTIAMVLKVIESNIISVCLNGICEEMISLMFQSLGLRGVLDLLGVRCTVGSHNILPPPKETLLESFTRSHHPSAKLSVGGRALSKHSHRDDTLQWWGICTGSKHGSQSPIVDYS